MPIGSNVEVQGLNNFTAVKNLFVSGTLTTSGSVSLGSSVYDVDSYLELSSSAGSVVSFSASADFPNTDKNYHVRSVNSRLILSSSAGGVAISGNLRLTGTVLPFENLGCSLGESSTPLRFANLYLQSIDITSGQIQVGNGLVNIPTYGFSSEANSGLYRPASQKLGFTIAAVLRTSFSSSGHIIGETGHLILSSSAGSIVALSASQDFVNTDRLYHIRSVNDHLVLSSSAGSVVRISGALGALDLTTATLPANNVILSGSIVWDSTRKALKIYGPEGWSVIATGTTG